LEQSRRRFLALVGLGLVAAAGIAWALLDGPARAPHQEPAALAGPERIVVEVLNGSGRRGLARTATRVLRQAGFDVVFFGSAGDPVRVTQALARRGDSAAAARVAAALGASRVRVAIDTLLRVDVTVLLGDDYKPPPGIRP
jgi:LytR cell envelope-related transcriptional attenuator